MADWLTAARSGVPTGEAGVAGADVRVRFIAAGPTPTGGTSIFRLEHAKCLSANPGELTYRRKQGEIWDPSRARQCRVSFKDSEGNEHAVEWK